MVSATASPALFSSNNPSWRRIGEFAVAVAALIVVILAQMRVAGSFYLLHRDYWYDEILTQTIVSDPDYGHAMRGLAHGIETHPPTLYTVLRFYSWIAGGANEFTLRLFSMLCVLSALAGLYLLLRQSFKPLVCFTALLALWCHPLVVVQAFEARAYAPWLAGIVWYTYFLSRARSSRSWLWDILIGLSAAFVCTVHYFGIVSLGLVTVFELASRWWSKTPLWRGMIPALCGPLALLACVPFLLGQKAAMTVPTWMEHAGLGWSFEYLGRLWFPAGLAAVVVLAWLARTMQTVRGQEAPTESSDADLVRQLPLTGLLLMPLVMIVFSFTVQTVLHEKYAIPTLAGMAPAVAYLLARMSKAWLGVACLVLCLAGIQEHHRSVLQRGDHDHKFTAALIDTLRHRTGTEDLLFDNLHNLYVVCRYAPDLRDRCYYLDFERGEIGNTPDARVFARDLARQYAKHYGTPKLKRWGTLKQEAHFYLVPEYLPKEPDATAPEPYPGFVTRPFDKELVEVVCRNP